MIKNVFKLLGKTIKTTTKSIGKSLDFIDETLESEHIIKAAEKTKQAAGSLITKAGETYQKTVNTIEEIKEIEQVANVLDQAKEVGGKIVIAASNTIEAGKEKIKSNEVLNKTIESISDTGKAITEGIETKTEQIKNEIEDSIFGESEEE